MEREQNQMKKDLAEVKAYAEAMVDSNWVRDVYIDKEQNKFFQQLNRQRSNINSLKCYIRIPKESGRSRGEEGESRSGSGSSYRLPVVTGSQYGCE